jgi:lipid II:glycine glycyltransferase (peptidoglycan interpeptide bridge formation enzyme)
MVIEEIDPVADSRWNDFVRSHPYGSFYHLAEWGEVLQKTFSYKPYYLVVKKDGAISAGLPFMFIKSWLTGKRLVALPRTPYCDPLVTSPREMQALIEHMQALVRASGKMYFEIRPHFNEEILPREILKSHCYFQSHIVEMGQDQDALWKSFHRSCVRQRVGKAQKTDVRVRMGHGEKDLVAFYHLYQKTARKHLIPAKPFAFFKTMWDRFSPRDEIVLLLAIHKDLPIAANLSFIFKDTWYYEFLGLDYDFISLSAGHLLVWEAIQLAFLRQCKYFDFGLTPIENKGLRSFKKHWRAREQELHY